MHAVFCLAHALKRADGFQHLVEIHARARCVGNFIRADQRKGDDVDAAVHQIFGDIFVHAQAAGGGGDGAARPPGKGRKIEEARVQQRFAPALKMRPPALPQQGPEPGKGFRPHVPGFPAVPVRGVRAVEAAPRTGRADFNLRTVQLPGRADQAFLQLFPETDAAGGAAQRIGMFSH